MPSNLFATEKKQGTNMGEKDMEIEEARKLKAELEAEILKTIQRFTTKTGIYVREIALYGNLRVGCGDAELNMRVEAKTSL